MRRTVIASLISLLVAAGCGKEAPPPAPTPTARTPASVPLSDFGHIGYLIGNWRGQGATGAPFYERYTRLDDSTIQTYSFRDSTFSAAADSGHIRWSSNQVRSGTPELSWIATLWTADSVRFDPERSTSPGFVWIRESPDAWQARLGPLTAPVVYRMTRVP